MIAFLKTYGLEDDFKVSLLAVVYTPHPELSVASSVIPGPKLPVSSLTSVFILQLNIEPNHTTLAGHAYEHDVIMASK